MTFDSGQQPLSATTTGPTGFAFALRDPQTRFLSVTPARPDVIKQIELVKGRDATAPIVLAVTVETMP